MYFNTNKIPILLFGFFLKKKEKRKKELNSFNFI